MKAKKLLARTILSASALVASGGAMGRAEAREVPIVRTEGAVESAAVTSPPATSPQALTPQALTNAPVTTTVTEPVLRPLPGNGGKSCAPSPTVAAVTSATSPTPASAVPSATTPMSEPVLRPLPGNGGKSCTPTSTPTVTGPTAATSWMVAMAEGVRATTPAPTRTPLPGVASAPASFGRAPVSGALFGLPGAVTRAFLLPVPPSTAEVPATLTTPAAPVAPVSAPTPATQAEEPVLPAMPGNGCKAYYRGHWPTAGTKSETAPAPAVAKAAQ